MNDFDVLIVGYGPVGATLAALLGRLGVHTAVVEREAGVYHQPRAAHFDDEIMRVLQTLGIADDVAEAVVPVRGMHFMRLDGTVLLRYDVAPGAGAQGWDGGYLFYQPELEQALRGAVDELDRVEAALETEVVHLEDIDGGVRVHLRGIGGGRERAVTASWVVGCDGGRSTVRACRHLELDDLGLHQPWLVCDLRLRHPVELPSVVFQICEPTRPATFVPMPGNRRRFEWMVLPGEDPEELLGQIGELAAPWLDPSDYDVERATVYTFHALSVRRWRDGHVLLAGDAAHQMPPFLGQGMCSGLRDAANLAWKLALVCQGRADDTLLETYQQERDPHVRTIIERAIFLGGVIQTTDPHLAHERDGAFLSGAAPRPEAVRADLGPGLHGDEPAPAGTLAPQPHVVVDGAVTARLDDRIGYRFAVLGATDGVTKTTRACWDAVDAVLVAADDPDDPLVTEVRRLLDSWGATAAIIRPDRYVLGIARDAAGLDRMTADLADRLRAPDSSAASS